MSFESFLGSIWFAVAAFAAGVLLSDSIKAAINRLRRH